MRMSTDIQRTTRRGGKAISPKYAGRQAGVKDASVNNKYATVDAKGNIHWLQANSDGSCDLESVEKDVYVELFQDAVDQIAENYKKDGHPEDIKFKSAAEWLTHEQYCPYRMSFTLGDKDDHATEEQTEKATIELLNHIAIRYPRMRIASVAIHKDGESGKTDVHIAMVPAADKKTRKGQQIMRNGQKVRKFDVYEALAQDGQVKYFKDADYQIKAVTDPDIIDPALMREGKKDGKKFCNELIGFTQEIRQHMFKWCEKNLGLELEREPDETRSRDPYDEHQSSNARLSTKDYIAADKAKKVAEAINTEYEILEEKAAELQAQQDEINSDEGLAYRTLKLIEKHGSPNLKAAIDKYRQRQQNRDITSANAMREFLQQNTVLQRPEAGPEI